MDLSEPIDAMHQDPASAAPAPAAAHASDDATEMASQTPRQAGMSYKFQRLREKLRQAIRSGEFNGKLPGERMLAKRFAVNAKTLSKALTDLAAEGLLDRSIGRGTYVKGSAPAAQAQGRWLVLVDADDASNPMVERFRAVNPQLDVATDVRRMRPSFLNGFSAVIDLATNTPESFLRDLVVRNVPVVAVGREPKSFSMHAVLPDLVLGVSRLARDLMLAGHRRIAAVEPSGSTLIAHTVRQSASRYAPEATIDACSPEDVDALVHEGMTAIVCDSARSATRVRATLERRGIRVPGDVSVAAVGYDCDHADAPCSGYFVDAEQIVQTAVGLLREPPSRPATLWLAGDFADAGTVGASSSSSPSEGSAGGLGDQLDPSLVARLEGMLV